MGSVGIWWKMALWLTMSSFLYLLKCEDLPTVVAMGASRVLLLALGATQPSWWGDFVFCVGFLWNTYPLHMSRLYILVSLKVAS